MAFPYSGPSGIANLLAERLFYVAVLMYLHSYMNIFKCCHIFRALFWRQIATVFQLIKLFIALVILMPEALHSQAPESMALISKGAYPLVAGLCISASLFLLWVIRAVWGAVARMTSQLHQVISVSASADEYTQEICLRQPESEVNESQKQHVKKEHRVKSPRKCRWWPWKRILALFKKRRKRGRHHKDKCKHHSLKKCNSMSDALPYLELATRRRYRRKHGQKTSSSSQHQNQHLQELGDTKIYMDEECDPGLSFPKKKHASIKNCFESNDRVNRNRTRLTRHDSMSSNENDTPEFLCSCPQI